MRINKITIKNFRSFDKAGQTITFPNNNHPISIVGHNNSGKTNFIRALTLGLGVKSTYNTFSIHDFHNNDFSHPIHIELETAPPLKSADAYNNIKEMPIIKLIVSENEGQFESSHQFYQADGKAVFNVTAVARGKNKTYSQDDKDLLNANIKKGNETVFKWQSKIPVYYIDPISIHQQLKVNKGTLLGKVINVLKKDFEDKKNVVEKKEGIHEHHVGKPRIDVFNAALEYLEKYIVSTAKVEEVISKIEEVVKAQLEIGNEDFQLLFGLPTIDSFYDNLTFYIKDNPDKPKLPVQHLGNGFSSLFIVALFRALLNSDDGGNVFIIEEPETYLHEHFQEYFYEVLIKLAQNNQVIITTHSKKFIDIFKPETIVRFCNEKYLHTRAVQKAEPEIEVPTIDNLHLHSINDFAFYLRSLEPNLNNIVFSSKVFIVEGPHDLLAYKIFFSKKINLSFSNIAVICAWGKDTITSVVQLCQRYEVPYFVIHDWDLEDDGLDVAKGNPAYNDLIPADKAQFTKNLKILINATTSFVHQNKRNLESVLNIDEKGTPQVFERLSDKTFEEIQMAYPKFFSQSMIDFLM